jgi:hypothetical protein
MSGGLLQHVLKCVVGCVAVPVVTPVAGSCTGIRGIPLVKSAAVEVVAQGVAPGKVIGVDVDVSELQHFDCWCVRLKLFGISLVAVSCDFRIVPLEVGAFQV